MKFFVLLALLTLPLCAMSPIETQQTVLIILGAPGAGKGTQAVRLSESLEIPQISTGDLFRENLRNETAIGKKAKEYMDSGQLVPDEVVLDMLFDRLQAQDCQTSYILDGFPRTIPQAEVLDKRLNASGSNVIAISLEVPDQTILERLTGRIVCEKCGAPYHKVASPPKVAGKCDRCDGELIQRKDDTKEVILDRLNVFHEQTEPVKSHYEKQGALILIKGDVSKEETISQLDSKLKKFLD